MKPNTVHHIYIDGSQRNAAQHLSDLQRKAMELHIIDYQNAGMSVPQDVIDRAREMGIEVKA